MDAARYDVVLSEDLSPADLRVELSSSLWLKGYCVLDAGLDDELLEDAVAELLDLKRAGRFESPPQQVVDGILGPEGTRELAWLPDPGDSEYAEGDRLRAVSESFSAVVGATETYCKEAGLRVQPTQTVAVRGGEVSDEIVELTDEDCRMWLSTIGQAALMAVFFLGPGEGTLELLPLDEEGDDVEIQTRRNMVLVFRADMFLHPHVSSLEDYALVRWLKATNVTTARGWVEMESRLVRSMPSVRELLEWRDQRLQAIIAMEMEGKLDESVSREWRRLAHRTYFRHDRNPIAIRGDGGHLPGLWDPASFWQSCNDGVDYLTQVPPSRWDHANYYDPEPDCWKQSHNFLPPMYVKTNIRHGQFIDGLELFDAKFFGISVMEAKGMDPMQKHVLETSYEALWKAGYRKKDLMNSYIAVYTGASHAEWNYIDREAGACSGTGASQAITSNRTSFALGMMGPSSSMDCEMASAAVALTVGAAAVSTTNARRVESGANSSAAVVGGVYFALTPFLWPRFNAWMNPRGRSFTFDESADGYVRGEMCGSVCLKPYGEKVDKTFIVPDEPCAGCLRGWRTVSTGRAASLTAPHGPAEQECVHDAIRDACIDVDDVDAVECHGIGSPLDDGVEVTSLARVFRRAVGEEQEPLVLGAVKTHVSAQCEACGMASLFRVLYNIAYASHAPNVHLKQLNPHIDARDAAIVIGSEPIGGRARQAFHGFTSRGLGGTMVHGIAHHQADASKVRGG